MNFRVKKTGLKRFLTLAVWVLALVVICLAPAPARAGGALTLSFDDGHISTYNNALPILEPLGIKATANVVVNWILNRTDCMYVSQLKDLESRGWEIVSHSLTHPHFYKIPPSYANEVLSGWVKVLGAEKTYQASFGYEETPILIQDATTLLTKKDSATEVEAQAGSWYHDTAAHIIYVHTTDGAPPTSHEIRADSVQRELEGSKMWLEESGLTIWDFAVPHSQWSWEGVNMAKAYYVSCASYTGPPPDYPTFNSIPPTDKRWLARVEIRRETTVAEVKTLIDQAKANNKWLILMFHAIGDYTDDWTWTQAKLQELANYIKSSGIKVVTQIEGLYLTNPKPDYPTFSLTANGQAEVYRGTTDEMITISLDMTAGSFAGKTGEAWVAVDLPWGSTVYYVAGVGWVDDPTPYGPYVLSDKKDIVVWKSMLPWPGLYTFYAGVDEYQNGVLDSPDFRGTVTVEITE